jgi:hypothetical protein
MNVNLVPLDGLLRNEFGVGRWRGGAGGCGLHG